MVNKGLDDRQVKFGCVQPGETSGTFGDALRKLADRATYLYDSAQQPATSRTETSGRNKKYGIGIVLAAVAVLVLAIGGYLYLHRAPKLTDKDTIILADFTGKITCGVPILTAGTPFFIADGFTHGTDFDVLCACAILVIEAARKSRARRSGHRAFLRAAGLRRHLDLDDAVLDGIDNQIADRVQTQFPHDVAAVSLHRLGAQVQ